MRLPIIKNIQQAEPGSPHLQIHGNVQETIKNAMHFAAREYDKFATEFDKLAALPAPEQPSAFVIYGEQAAAMAVQFRRQAEETRSVADVIERAGSLVALNVEPEEPEDEPDAPAPGM